MWGWPNLFNERVKPQESEISTSLSILRMDQTLTGAGLTTNDIWQSVSLLTQ